MMNRLGKSLIAIVGIASAIFQTQSAIAQNASVEDSNPIVQHAKDITVSIVTVPVLTSENTTNHPIGSGVLIRKDDNTYFVLTNKHVVAEDSRYLAIINVNYADSNPLEALPDPIQGLPRPVFPEQKPNAADSDIPDIALLEFHSQKEYRVAVLGDSAKLEQDSHITLGGYPNKNPHTGKEFLWITLKFTEIKKGFIYYSPLSLEGCNPNAKVICNAEEGMSGGPILNDQKQLVGIHKGTPDNKDKKNYGIPINTILQVFAQIPKTTLITTKPPNNNELPHIPTEPLIASPILINQHPSNQPFTNLFRPPVRGGF